MSCAAMLLSTIKVRSERKRDFLIFWGICSIASRACGAFFFALQQRGLSCFTGTCARQGAGVCNFLASGVDSNKTALYISLPVVGA
jgi:hypothetical protein